MIPGAALLGHPFEQLDDLPRVEKVLSVDLADTTLAAVTCLQLLGQSLLS